MRDRSRRVRAEQAARTSDARYRLIVDLAHEGIWSIDADAVTTFANRRMAEMLGCGVEDLLGSSPFDLMDDEGHALLGSAFCADATSGAAQLETKLLRTDGTELWIHATASPQLGPGGEYLGLTVLVTDVTEARRTRLALEQSEARNRSLVEHSDDIITVLDADGTWRYSSPAGTRQLGYAAGFDPPGGILSLVHPDDLPRAAEALVAIRDGALGRDEQVLLRVRAIDGRYRFFETVGQNLLDDPSVGGIVLNSRDVTDRVLAEEATRRHDLQSMRLSSLREREQLERELEITRRLGSLGRLAGGVAHDFNSTVGLVKLYLDSLTDKLQPSSELHDDAMSIREAIDHAGRLARQLLSSAREDRVEVLDPDELIPRITELVQPLLGDGVTVVHRMGAVPTRIVMSRVRFEQVIVNLALNARDALPDGGVITVSVEPFADGPGGARPDAGTGVGSGDYVRVTIADDGTGMTPEVAARAFEPFFTTRTERRGTGLGLAVVHGIVTDTGGSVTIDTEVGRGTTVVLALPAHPRGARSAAEAPTAAEACTADEVPGDADRFEA